MNKKVAVIGSMNYDIMTISDKFPEVGENCTVDSVSYSAGGKGLNQAYQVARLGTSTKFFGCIGDDIFGDYILDNVKNENLDLSFIEKSNSRTGMGLVHILDDGSVVGYVVKGANFDVDTKYIDKHIDEILECDYIILQLEIPTNTVEDIIEKAKATNAKVILNAAPAKEISFDSLRNIDTLVVNETEAKFYINKDVSTFESAEKFGREFQKELGINLIITLGSKGSIYFTSENSEIIHSVKPEKVLDTTGAGDSYIGAFVFALGKGYNIGDACRFASKVASKTVTKVGAQSAMPTFDEVNDDKGFEA